MPNQVLHRRGTEAQHVGAFVGGTGEITYITDNKFLAIHDSSTVGGFVVLKLTSGKRTLDLNGIVYANSTTTLTTSSSFTWDGTTFTVGTLTGMIKGASGVLSAVTGATNRVTYWTDANTIGSDANLTWDGTRFKVGASASIGKVDIKQSSGEAGISLQSHSDDSRMHVSTTGTEWKLTATYTTTGSYQPIQLWTSDLHRWSVTVAGILQSNGAQTIQSSSGILTVTGTGGLTLSTAANTNILLSPNGTGKVGISVTPDYLLHVGANIADWATYINNTHASGYGLLLRAGKADGTTTALQVNNVAGTGLFTVNGAGTVSIAALTQKSVLFAGASGAVSQDNANFQYDSTNAFLAIGGATVGTSGVSVFGIKNGTAPTTGPADTVQFYSSDDAAGHTIPSFFCEGTNVIATGQADSASSVRVKMRINGTVVTLLAI